MSDLNRPEDAPEELEDAEHAMADDLGDVVGADDDPPISTETPVPPPPD